MNRLNWFAQDVRYALRGFRRDRGFTLLAIVALALGIGATTVIFSVIENVLIEPFPYRAPDGWPLLRARHHPARGLPQPQLTGCPSFSTSRRRTMSSKTSWATPASTFCTPIATARCSSRAVGNTQHLRVSRHAAPAGPHDHARGRRYGAAPVFAMSHRLWKKQFNSDPALVGKTLVLNGQPRTLVSVMPPRFLLATPTSGCRTT